MGGCCTELEGQYHPANRFGFYHMPFCSVLLPMYTPFHLTVQPIRRPPSSLRPKGYWKEQQNQRQFFIDIAAEKGVDPVRPESWERITSKDILKKRVTSLFLVMAPLHHILTSYDSKGTGLVAKYGTLTRALENAFPELKGKLKGERGNMIMSAVITNDPSVFCISIQEEANRILATPRKPKAIFCGAGNEAGL